MSKLISHAAPTLSTCTSIQSHTLATREKAIASADIILHTRENGFCIALTRLLVKNNNIITPSVVRDRVHIAKLRTASEYYMYQLCEQWKLGLVA